MSKIINLDDITIKKIAAGEVVERPSSVVKELVENSIDAGATQIIVTIENGGKDLIKISDNGSGMLPEDAQKSFELHTTSKIGNIEDLEKIFTFGFRGEALASITAISETTIHTNQGDAPIKIIIENGSKTSSDSSPRTSGTTITVRALFRHLPARKKFLRTPTTEYKHILNEVIKIGLAYPEIAFELVHNNKTTLKLKESPTKNDRIIALFKSINQEDLIQINTNTPIANISGFVVHPRALSNDRSKQYLFLNNRFINERSLSKAVRNGYHSTISRDKHPAYFIFLDINPQQIDVNIHPKKLEAKIDRVNEIFPILASTITKALDNEVHQNLETKLGTFTQQTPTYPVQNPNYTTTQPKEVPFRGFRGSNPSFSSTSAVQKSLDFSQELLSSNETEQLFNAYQVLNTYIIIDRGEELQIIDQHAADEQINYEQILDKLSNGNLIEKKDLLIPIILDLDTTKIPLIEENIRKFTDFGLDIDIFGESKIKINAIPEFSREIKYNELIDELINRIEQNPDYDSPKFEKKLAASLACHGSIRAGRKLDQREIQKLISDLFNCKSPYACPHGRPFIWTLTKKEIEKKFERIK